MPPTPSSVINELCQFLKSSLRALVSTERNGRVPACFAGTGRDIWRTLHNELAATGRGLCILPAGGRLQGQTLLIHDRLPQTGADSPVYEVVLPAGEELPGPPRTVQDRLL